MTGRFAGRVAIVTGGAGGIGTAVVHAFASEGASVVVADQIDTGAESVATAIRDAGGAAVASPGELADESYIERMVGTALDEFGRLDILHNNAAMTSEAAGLDVDVVSMDAALWDRMFTVNVRAPMLASKYAIPAMLETTGRGAIVNTASAAGLSADVQSCAYGSSKAALIMLTKYVATTYGRQGIRCNAVAPGFIKTPTVAKALSPEILDDIASHCVTPYVGEPFDIAAAVMYLASDDARFVTGQVLSVDGGYLCHQPHYAQGMAAAGNRD
jgi:NAD(P)-dependent dehydrogenase (short-subunit alcohol dehydrogenase family)